MSKTTPLFSEQLREAIEDSDDTRYKISKATGISQQTLCRFASGQAGLRLEAIDTLCAYLGLKLVKRTKRDGDLSWRHFQRTKTGSG